MSQQTQRLLEFGEFRLNLDERRLERGGTVVPVTPKVFETLQVLVENAGHLVEKDEMMRRIWQDRFVEESNLSFNIKMLRKALGDDATKPRFIETVPRRGYRFVADVREGIVEKTSQNGVKPANSAVTEQRRVPSRLNGPRLSAFAVVVIAVVGAGGWWYASRNATETGAPILTTLFISENLSTNSRVGNAVISPDGKNVAYTNGLGSEKQTVWLRQLESSTNIQIVPPSDEFYYNLAFSPDGNFLYYVRGPKPGNPAEQHAIYRTSIFGGIATKIVSEVQGGMSVSPDGSRLSFVRCYYRDDELCSLWIADSSDGKNERKLVARPSPIRIGDNRISPDGRKIAFAFGQSRNGSNEFSLAEVDIATGLERELTGQKFFDVKQLLWLPDQRELLFTALQLPDKHSRIWRSSVATGQARPLTTDSEDYWGLSIDQQAQTLVATQRKSDFQLNLYSAKDLKARQLLADAATVAFSTDGKLVVSSGHPGNLELWSVNSEGGGERQLTNDPADDVGAVVSPNGATIFFASNRTGETQIWRMNSDGTDQKQVTATEGGTPLGVAPDGKWIYYHSALGRTLKKVSVDGGREETLIDKHKPVFAVSPDCSQAAFTEMIGDRAMLAVVSLENGHTVSTFRIGDEKPRIVGIAWSGNGEILYYISAVNDYEGNTLWAQSLITSTSRKIGDLPGQAVRNSSSFAVSPDGESFAVVQGTWKRDAVLIKGLK